MRRILRSSAERVIDRLLSNLPDHQAERLRLHRRRLLDPVRLGTLRRTTPISDQFGYDRGTPIDRYYIERFLAEYSRHIRGRVLEVKDGTYTDRFGKDVTEQDVLDVDALNPHATIVADLASAEEVPEESFDCFILTQTLQFIYETHAAVAHANRILKPGGALLASVPVVSAVVDEDSLTHYWRFTPAGCSELFGGVFGHDAIVVRPYGNVLTAIAFLTGMAREELTTQELESQDSRFPMVVCVCALKK
jgi:SAM-dependent methyltransferase